MKKITTAMIAFVLLILAFSISVSASGMEEYNDFIRANGS